MRKRMFTLTLLIVSLIGQSQAQDTTQTLLKLIKPQTIGFYIAPEMGYGQVRGSMTSIGGMSGMLILNKKWAIGATSQMVTNRDFAPSAISPNYLRAAWMGGKVEYTLKPDRLFHISFPLMVGMGRASVDSLGSRWGRRDDWHDYRSSNTSKFLVVQPGVNVEMNLMRFAKLYVGANYRLSFSTDTPTTLLPANSLQGYSVNAGLRLGLFGVNLKRKRTETAPAENTSQSKN